MAVTLGELARQGNPEAIATLLSKPLHREGLSVQVARSAAGGLTIALQGVVAPERSPSLTYVRRSLEKLGLDQSESSVLVEGWAIAAPSPTWQEVLSFEVGRSLGQARRSDQESRSVPRVADSLTPRSTQDRSTQAADVAPVQPIARETPAPQTSQAAASAAPAGETEITPPPESLKPKPIAPAAPPKPRLNFADLQRIVGQAVDVATQPTIVNETSPGQAGAIAATASSAADLDPSVTNQEARAALDSAFDLIEAGIAQVRSRNLPVPNVALQTRIALGAVQLDIHLDVPTSGPPRLVKLNMTADAATLANQAAADPQNQAGAIDTSASTNAALPAHADTADTNTASTQPSGAIDNANLAAWPDLADRLAEARALQQAGHYDEMIVLLNGLAAQSVPVPEVYQLLSGALAATARGEESLLALKIARNLLIASGDEASVRDINQAFADRGIDPDGVGFHCIVAVVLYNQGNRDGAIGELETAIAGDPEDPTPYKILGGILGKQGQIEEAKAHLRKAQTLYLKRGELEQAQGIESFFQDASG